MVPLSFGYDGDALYFHTASEGKKLDIMIANPSVCFEFEQDVSLNTHDTLPCKWGFSFKSVIGHGEVSEVTSAEYKKTALNHILQTYSNQEWDFQDAAVAATRVWKITIHQLTGKQS